LKVISLKDCPEFTAGDNSLLREILSPLKDKTLRINYSMAYAKVKPGQRTLLHSLDRSEVYHIIRGKGVMQIHGEKKEVKVGDTIYIPPNAHQRIQNTGKEELIFICIVEPAWEKKGEKVLEETDPG